MRFNLIKLRKTLKLSQEEMAKKLDVSRPHYSNIENGKADPTFGVMKRFEELFKEQYEDIWELFKIES